MKTGNDGVKNFLRVLDNCLEKTARCIYSLFNYIKCLNEEYEVINLSRLEKCVDVTTQWFVDAYDILDSFSEQYQIFTLSVFLQYSFFAFGACFLGSTSKLLLLLSVFLIAKYEKQIGRKKDLKDLRAMVLEADQQTLDYLLKFLNHKNPFTAAKIYDEHAQCESVNWFNELLKESWHSLEPYFRDKLVQLIDIINHFLSQEDRRLMGKFSLSQLIGLRMYAFRLGKEIPKVHSVRVIKQHSENDEEKMFVVDLDIVYKSDAELELFSTKFKVGLKDLYVKGKLRLELGPNITAPPWMKGLSLYLLEVPEIDFDSTSLACTIDQFTGETLSNKVKSLILNALSEIIVMPNSIQVPFLDDHTSIRCPTPKGAIRLRVVEARDLPDNEIFYNVDPYVTIQLGASKSVTHTIKNCRNPCWGYWAQFVCIGEPSLGGPDLILVVMNSDALRTDTEVMRVRLNSYEIYSKQLVDKWLEDPSPTSTAAIKIQAMWLPFTDDATQLPVQISEIAAIRSGSLSKKEFKDGVRSCDDPSNHLSFQPLFSCVFLLWIDYAVNLPEESSNWRIEVEAGGDIQHSWPAYASKTVKGKWLWKQSFLFNLNKVASENLSIKLKSHEGVSFKGRLSVPIEPLLRLPYLSTGNDTKIIKLSNGRKIPLTLDMSLKILSPAGSLMNDLKLINKAEREITFKERFKFKRSVSKNALIKPTSASSQEILRKLVSTSTFYSDVYCSQSDLSSTMFEAPAREETNLAPPAQKVFKATKSLPADKRKKSIESSYPDGEVKLRNKERLHARLHVPNALRNSISLEDLPNSDKESRSLSKAFRRIKSNSKRHAKDIFKPSGILHGMSVDQNFYV